MANFIEINEKPPIGLIPEELYSEITNRKRVFDIIEAIERYSVAKKVIPLEWATELKLRTKKP
jgi:hypothetical protein